MRNIQLKYSRAVYEHAYVNVQVPDDWTDAQVKAWARKNHDGLIDIGAGWEEAEPGSGPPDSITVGPIPATDDYGIEATPTDDGGYTEYVEPDPKYEEPSAAAWIQWRDHEWATDGYILVRKDGPRPSRYVEWKLYRLTSKDLDGVIHGAKFAPATFMGHIIDHGGGRIRIYKNADGTPIGFTGWRSDGFDGLDCFTDPSRGFIIGKRDGETVALLMKVNYANREAAMALCAVGGGQ